VFINVQVKLSPCLLKHFEAPNGVQRRVSRCGRLTS